MDAWKEIDEDDIRDGASKFKQLLKESAVDAELAEEILSGIKEIQNEKHNIICFFTCNKWAVTCIHVPDEALGEEESPMLMRGANPRHIIAAFAQSEIRKKISSLDGIEIITGLPQDDSENDKWSDELESMCEQVMDKIESNPPEMWEDLLGGR